jgi:hypothetical protein
MFLETKTLNVDSYALNNQQEEILDAIFKLINAKGITNPPTNITSIEAIIGNEIIEKYFAYLSCLKPISIII